MRRWAVGVSVVLLGSVVSAPARAAFTERVSVGIGGAQANSHGYPIQVSPDGRLVMFFSLATNLPGGGPGTFVHDRSDGTTTRIFSETGVAVTPDMRFIAYDGVYVFDRMTNTTELVSVAMGGGQGNGQSNGASISADGRFVAFVSFANNLVPGDTNFDSDIFVRDRLLQTTERVNVADDGTQAEIGRRSLDPTISADGRFVAFHSLARNLVAGGTNGRWHVFLRDRDNDTTELLSILPDGSQDGSETCCSGGIAMTPDASMIAFVDDMPLVPPPGTRYDVYVRDRGAATTELVSVAMGGAQSDGVSFSPTMSADGRFVAFASIATNLVPGGGLPDTEVFLRDRQLGTTERINVATDGTPGTPGSDSALPRISADGRVIAFLSTAANLVAADTNDSQDVFVRDRLCGNGATDGNEQCDDGNNDDGDGCDANCTSTGCGNGRATTGEVCDHGGTNGADDCCSPTCTLVDTDADGTCNASDVCTGPAIADTRLQLRGVLTPDADDRLVFRGRITLPGPVVPPPATNGIRLLVTDALGGTMLDTTIPGGAGWKVRGGTSRYTAGNGIIKVKTKDAGGLVRFSIKGKGQLFTSGAPPLVATLFLRPPDDTLGACGQARPACTSRADGNRVTCR